MLYTVISIIIVHSTCTLTCCILSLVYCTLSPCTVHWSDWKMRPGKEAIGLCLLYLVDSACLGQSSNWQPV